MSWTTGTADRRGNALAMAPTERGQASPRTSSGCDHLGEQLSGDLAQVLPDDRPGRRRHVDDDGVLQPEHVLDPRGQVDVDQALVADLDPDQAARRARRR